MFQTAFLTVSTANSALLLPPHQTEFWFGHLAFHFWIACYAETLYSQGQRDELWMDNSTNLLKWNIQFSDVELLMLTRWLDHMVPTGFVVSFGIFVLLHFAPSVFTHTHIFKSGVPCPVRQRPGLERCIAILLSFPQKRAHQLRWQDSCLSLIFPVDFVWFPYVSLASDSFSIRLGLSGPKSHGAVLRSEQLKGERCSTLLARC